MVDGSREWRGCRHGSRLDLRPGSLTALFKSGNHRRRKRILLCLGEIVFTFRIGICSRKQGFCHGRTVGGNRNGSKLAGRSRCRTVGGSRQDRPFRITLHATRAEKCGHGHGNLSEIGKLLTLGRS
ncbi:hypothetical protein D3C78_1291450 [compost metagenome]